MTLRTTFTGRVPELDGLRGVAIALVLIVHLSGLLNGAPGTFSAYVVRSCMLAWSGVDLFFVLSGFLIGGILLDAKSSDHYFRTFYIRRAFRILPLYTVLNLAPLLLVFASPHLRDTAYFVLGRPLPWYVTAFFGQNLVIAFTGVWGNAYLAATWSLAVEEQFYLTLPFVVRKVSTRTLTTLSVATIVAAPFIRMLAARFVSLLAVYTVVRFDALMFGVLAAIAVRRAGSGDVFGKHTRVLLTSAASLLAIALMIFTKRGWNHESSAMNTAGYSVIAAFYCCLLLLAVAPRDNPLRGLLRCRGLIKLGTIAYCVYLVHAPMLSGTYRLLSHRPPHLERLEDLGPLLLAFALTFAIAAISWRYFERPLIAVGHRFLYKVSSVASKPEFVTATIRANGASLTATSGERPV